ncbi:MAG: hypothetical protein HY961_09660 [Ignavibacteriae bacterium]|nr:hypothetical protein [Ignavibacteriota bacterium]
MRIIAIAAVLGAIVAMPFIFGTKKTELIPVKKSEDSKESDLRYDVNDLVN